jgi:hypothetical protein
MQNNFLIHFKIRKTILVYKTINYWNLRRAAHNIGGGIANMAGRRIYAQLFVCSAQLQFQLKDHK